MLLIYITFYKKKKIIIYIKVLEIPYIERHTP
ncbi:hypothetical protein THDSLph1_CDS0055 [Terrisporobacter phage TPDSL_ph1]